MWRSTVYPEFAISQGERESLSKWKLRCLQEEKIKKEIEAKRTVKMTTKYFISLPCEEAHSEAGVHAQKLQPAISQKIVELVEAGIMDTNEIKKH